MRIPTEAAGGIAKATLTYQGAKGKEVTSATVEFNVPANELKKLLE